MLKPNKRHFRIEGGKIGEVTKNIVSRTQSPFLSLIDVSLYTIFWRAEIARTHEDWHFLKHEMGEDPNSAKHCEVLGGWVFALFNVQ